MKEEYEDIYDTNMIRFQLGLTKTLYRLKTEEEIKTKTDKEYYFYSVLIGETDRGYSFVNLSSFAGNWVIKFSDKNKNTNIHEIVQLYKKEDWKKLAAINPDLAPFFCQKCQKVYEEGWNEQESIESDGWYDSTHATCPKGHTQIIYD